MNTLLLPPVHLRHARDAVTALIGEVAAQLRDMADSVRDGWSANDAYRWAHSARGLRGAVRRADDAVWYGRESVRWNPRRRLIRQADSLLAGRDVVDRLSRVSERVLQVSVLLANLTEHNGTEQNGAGRDEHPGDPELAGLLERLADAVDVLGEAGPGELAAALDAPGAEARRLREGAGDQAARGASYRRSDAVAELEACS